MTTAIDQFAKQLKECDALDIVRRADHAYTPGVVLASNFGAEGLVLVDMLTRVSPPPSRHGPFVCRILSINSAGVGRPRRHLFQRSIIAMRARIGWWVTSI
jgi:3'-phosphoadenosine 5'-phosphosulfate sulfotransferase (PAPS reductase)/FAD synthetase